MMNLGLLWCAAALLIALVAIGARRNKLRLLDENDRMRSALVEASEAIRKQDDLRLEDAKVHNAALVELGSARIALIDAGWNFHASGFRASAMLSLERAQKRFDEAQRIIRRTQATSTTIKISEGPTWDEIAAIERIAKAFDNRGQR